jgi:hypothetical protein
MGTHVRKRHTFSISALAVLLVTANIVLARPPVAIRTGSNTAANGYLEIRPDEYGAWAAVFATGAIGPNGDQFRPNGSTLQVTAFSSGFFLFGPTNQRELLTDNADWQATTNGAGGPAFSADTSLSRSVISANVPSDSNGDGIVDTLNSAFRVFAPAGGTDLGFQLRQQVSGVSASVSFMQQNYTVTNNGAAPISFKMVRMFDGDLLWDANFESDSVGTNGNGDPAGPSVFEQEPNQPGQSVTLSMQGANAYFGGKHGVVPAGGAPAFDFGTDTEVWDVFGTPTSWINHIAGVGYNTNGQSGPAPPGSTVPRDAFMGMEMQFNLAPGANASFVVFHTYGQTTPIPEPATIGMIGIVSLLGLRRARRI